MANTAATNGQLYLSRGIMQQLLELGTGQVAFLSGLLSGFSLTIAVHVLRRGLKEKISQAVFSLFVFTTLLFLVALYTDVRLTIELAGIERLSEDASVLLSHIRTIGTGFATAGFIFFILSIGLLGWIATPFLGMLTSVAALSTLALFAYIWIAVGNLQTVL